MYLLELLFIAGHKNYNSNKYMLSYSGGVKTLILMANETEKVFTALLVLKTIETYLKYSKNHLDELYK